MELQSANAADALPFQSKVEVYRDAQNDITAFTVRLEQDFLADEFQKNSYLRLRSSDDQAYLIYPKETRFQQKHAEFYGRLRGEGKVTLKLAYETISENLDGSRHVEVREGKIEVPIPRVPDTASPSPLATIGPKSVFLDWARQQNSYFAELLQYYPEETFYQYCLLQSRARYGVEPPPIPSMAADREQLEANLYQFATGSMAIQDSLQRHALSSGSGAGDLTTHVSTLRPPTLRSPPYRELIEKKRTEEKTDPSVPAISRLVPRDQYFVHFRSMESLGELLDLSTHWGADLLRLFTVRAQDERLQAKLEDQLCLRRDSLARLFSDGVVSEVAATGSDPFVLEGTDVTLILGLNEPEAFDEVAAAWIADVREEYPEMVDREFNYRGHKVAARYTKDRLVSSFVVRHEGYIIYSNSHRAIRHIIDTAVSMAPALYDALDFRYVTTILPPLEGKNAGYVFASEAFIKRLVSPEAKVSEKRRLQCFNNLVMLNNASLFFRLEHGRSPNSLTELIEGRFVDPKKIVCPHGGAYAFDSEKDTCTCSLHNRLKYLTPNVELPVLKVSRDEAAEYERYKKRYQEFWQQAFNPIAVRVTVEPQLKFETCVLPFANGAAYQSLRDSLDKNPRRLDTARIAPSAVASLLIVPGREHTGSFLSMVPGVAETLKANPTLTDMKWIGDCVGIHYCDGEMVLQIDPTELSPTSIPMLGEVPVQIQTMVSALLMGVNLPVYVTIDVENRDSAALLLEQLSRQIFLKKGTLLPGVQTKMDAYRLPDYKEHAIYVFSGQVYALKIRLHAALVADQLVVATKPEVLREVIDATGTEPSERLTEAHVLVRINRNALDRMQDDLELYWAEKSRRACHRNIISIYNLCKLYETAVDDVSRLSEAKYGVRYFCPDGGQYRFDPERSEVQCSVHGNRTTSRQHPRPDCKSSFARFAESLDEAVASLRYGKDALIVTLDIVRSEE